jgi:hypothetical protein
MAPIDCLGISWQQLRTQVAELHALPRWVRMRSALAGIRTLEDLKRRVHCPEDPVGSDAVLGAMVRLAAREDGDDQLAGLVVAHLLAFRARGLAWRLRDLDPDIDELVMGALWMVIRGFPCARRARGYATSLLLDTRREVLSLIRPLSTNRGDALMLVGDLSRVVDPEGSTGQLASLTPRRAEPPLRLRELADPARSELEDLFEWAVASGVADLEDVTLLWALVAAEDHGRRPGPVRSAACTGAAAELVAEALGVCSKTVIRRRNRVLVALQGASDSYLDETA